MLDAGISFCGRRWERTRAAKRKKLTRITGKLRPLLRSLAPYRHARLSAMKVAGDLKNPARFNDNATADELRAELMKRLEILTSAGLDPLAGAACAGTGEQFGRCGGAERCRTSGWHSLAPGRREHGADWHPAPSP